VQNGGQDRPKQKLRKVEGGIGERVLLDGDGAGMKGRGRSRLGQGRSRRVDRARQRARSVVPGREVLPVVEDDDLRPLLRLKVLLERIACIALVKSVDRSATLTPGADAIA
jgi:hypothetical protein